MKKVFNYMLLLMASAVLTLTGCQKEELVFDHELPQFEIQEDAILLEVIVPSGTAVDDEIYITGEFSDGAMYKLEKAEKSDKKWGIYLYESDFKNGKTLKDGFTFVSKKEGKAYDVKGAPESYTLDVAYGTRTNVWINRWESFYKQQSDIVPGKYLEIYLTGNVEGSNWDPANPIVLEMVGTDIFRAEITFTDATSWFAISTAKGDWDAFNGARWGANGAALTADAPLDIVCDGSEQTITIAAGTYTITVNMVTNQIVIGEGNWDQKEEPGKYEHLYILGNVEGTGWTPAEPLELKKVGRDLFRGEFTFVPDGTNTTCYFAFATEKGATNDDWATLNAARWGGGELKEGEYLPLTLQTTSDVTATIAPGTYTITVNMIFKEAVIGEGDWSGREEPKDDDPKDDPTIVPDTITTHLYFINETTNMNYVYTYGDGELFGGWPGADWTTWSQATFLGQHLYAYEFKQPKGFHVTGIINNNAGKQIEPAFNITVGDKTDYFFVIGDDAVTELTPTPANAEAIRRLFRK